MTIDDKTVKRVKFRFNVATPMTTESLDKLSKSLGAAFKDKATTARLADLKDPLNALYADMNPEQAIQARLDGLKALFADKPSQNDTQYKALRDLKRAVVQHEASVNNHSVLDNARFETSKTSLSGLSKESILTRIMGSIREASAPGNAARVAEYMRQDPTLSAMVKQLENSQGTLARVRLEPKDSLIDDIDEGSRRGTLTQTQLSGLLENRNNMRIKKAGGVPCPTADREFHVTHATDQLQQRRIVEREQDPRADQFHLWRRPRTNPSVTRSTGSCRGPRRR